MAFDHIANLEGLNDTQLTTGVYLYKLGKMRVITFNNQSTEIPATGLELPESAKRTYYRNNVLFNNGTSDVSGAIVVSGNNVKLSTNGVFTKALWVTDEIVYFVS